jgi:hypothetical protein
MVYTYASAPKIPGHLIAMNRGKAFLPISSKPPLPIVE